MSKVERFEDLKVWQLAREICKEIHKLTLKDSFSRDFKLVRYDLPERFRAEGKQI